jgi:hypothetical protein
MREPHNVNFNEKETASISGSEADAATCEFGQKQTLK